ncbi:MAG: hypothetical protein JO277_06095 [Candidatus Eremiobacteraeota bacterium]|nr:hypothetical protein [Candidatus Eremiobacteraeota bacterium]
MVVGNPGPGIVGVRATPAFTPTPNNEPMGALTGAPVRTTLRSYQIIPASAVGQGGREATLIVPPTASNRVAILLAPLVAFRIYIGGSGVTPQTGFALPQGQPYETILPGLQEIYAVTDAPIYLALQVQVAPILYAEQQRKVG